MSAAFFAIGFALAVRKSSPARLFAAGLFCGLAFECRYQSGILGLGLFAWLAIKRQRNIGLLARFLCGGLLALAIGAGADRRGYGAWVFPLIGYFQINLVNDLAAEKFGREPIFAYLYLVPAQFFILITIVLMIAMVAMWIRNPSHPVTWATLPFVLVHSLIAHKEARFLFPLAILATSFPALGFSPSLQRGRTFFTRLWKWHTSRAAAFITLMSLSVMTYLAVYPFGIRSHMPMVKYIYRHFNETAYSFDKPFEPYPMFLPGRYRGEKLTNVQQLEALLDKGPVYLMSTRPSLPEDLPPGIHATMLYSEFPLGERLGRLGTRYVTLWTDFAARESWLKLAPLYWYTLYRLERSPETPQHLD